MTPLSPLVMRAIHDGHAEEVGDGPRRKIRYVAANFADRLSDPEERVRAEFWAELIYNYGYDPQRIAIEFTVPDRKPTDRADIVLFRDAEWKRPFAVFECKAEGVTDAEFEQAVEQVCGWATRPMSSSWRNG